MCLVKYQVASIMLKTMIPTTSYTAFGIPWGIIDQRLIISARTVSAFRGLHQIAVDRSRSVGLFMVLAFWSSAAVSSTETSAELCREGGGGWGGRGFLPQAARCATSRMVQDKPCFGACPQSIASPARYRRVADPSLRRAAAAIHSGLDSPAHPRVVQT